MTGAAKVYVPADAAARSLGADAIVDPTSPSDYVAHGGYRGLKNALHLTREQIVAAVTDSGLRGRGGAAFPPGIKWKTVLGSAADQKYVVCNADGGDSGTFADRMILESDPFVRRPARRASSAAMCKAAAARFISTCARLAAPTFAAKGRRCSKASRASSAWCVIARRCPPSRGCSASRRSSVAARAVDLLAAQRH